MKILRIIARLNVGGPARHVVWLSEALNDDEFSSTLIAGTVPEGEEDMSYFAAERGVEPLYIAEMSRELSPKDIVSLFKVYAAMLRERPDVIHTHTAKAGTVGRAAAFAYRWFTPSTLIGSPRRVKVIHTFHGHVFHSYYGSVKTKIFILIEKLLARFATDKIITITGQQLKEINEEVGIGRSKQFEVIPLGIDLSGFEPDDERRAEFRREVGLTDERLAIGFVGRLTEIKNIPLLLNAAKLYLEDENAPKSQFFIVGDGHLRTELEFLAVELGIADSVVFLGNRDDTERIYSGLDIVALTSLNEGTPLSLIESMAAGVPFVSTAVGGVIDLAGDVDDEKEAFRLCRRGVLAESGDVEGFAKGLIYLAKNEKLRFNLGEGGRRFVTEKYDKKRLIEDIKQLYRELTRT